MPSILQPAALANEQWNYIVAMLQAEAGLAAAPAGTSPGNRLAGIKYVGRAYALWTEQVPTIGVQLREKNEKSSATTRNLVTTTFDIIIGTQSTDASATARNGGTPVKANLEDAMSQLCAFVDDGSGNGIEPILRDPQYRTLGQTTVNGLTQQNAQGSSIVRTLFEWDSSGGEMDTAAQIWAYACITFVAQQQVSIF